MDGDRLYKQALEEIKIFATDVKVQCEMFAEEYNYERDWVFSTFKKELDKLIKED